MGAFVVLYYNRNNKSFGSDIKIKHWKSLISNLGAIGLIQSSFCQQ